MNQEPAEGRFDDITIFTTEDGQTRVEVRFQHENVWLTQKLMADLYECSADNISLHLRNVFAERELDAAATTEESSLVAEQAALRHHRKHGSRDRRPARRCGSSGHGPDHLA